MRRLLILFIVAILLVSGCGKPAEKTETQDQQQLSDKDIASVTDAELKAFLVKEKPKELPMTSFDRIDTALENNKIDEKQANILRIIANYQPDALPRSYQATPSQGRSSAQAAEVWMAKNYNTLDEKTKKALEPYYVSPFSDRFHMNAKPSSELAEALSLIPSVEAVPGEWKVRTTTLSDNPVRKADIFFIEGDMQMERQKNWSSEAFITAFQLHETLLGVRPQKLIYVYIENMSDYGTASMRDLDNETRCLIRLKYGMDEKRTKTTFAHELFHCFQFAIPLDYDPSDEQWLMESTATWSEHYVYPEYNSEHEYLPKFFDTLSKNMIHYGQTKEYSTYMWWLFRTQYIGDPEPVAEALKKAKTMSAKDATVKIDFFNSQFAEYAFWDWNFPPFTIYQDIPRPPGDPVGGHSYLQYIYDKEKDYPEFEAMQKLGIQYHLGIFSQNDIDKVTYTFETEGDEKHQRTALIKIGGNWYREDWTYTKERTFCRNRDEEKVLGVVLISSNADPDSSYDYPYKISTKGKCNPEWHGTTTWSYSYSWGDEIDGGALMHGKVDSFTDGRYISHETLVYDQEEDEFVVKRAFVTYAANERWIGQNLNDCGTMRKVSIVRTAGSGSYEWQIDEQHPADSDAPTKMRVAHDPLYYEVNVGIGPPGDWITSVNTNSRVYKPCPLEGVFTPGGGESGSTTMYSRHSQMSEPNSIQAKISEDGNRIQATVAQPWTHGEQKYNYNIEVDYRYS